LESDWNSTETTPEIEKVEGGKNEVVPEEPGKMGYIQPRVKQVLEWANGTIKGNGIWKSKGLARRFKTTQYINA
jgi:hypothetical protein